MTKNTIYSPSTLLRWGAIHPDDYAHVIVSSRNQLVDAALHELPRPNTIDDTASPTHIYEVGLSTFSNTTHWAHTPEHVWRAWVGPRRLNGEPHHGPVWHLDTNTPYNGPRDCACATCSASTAAPHRHN